MPVEAPGFQVEAPASQGAPALQVEAPGFSPVNLAVSHPGLQPRRAATTLLLLLIALAAVARAQSPDRAYLTQIEKFQAEQAQDLKTRWATLIGLFWLKPGPNSFGTDPANAIVLPKETGPRRAGSFDLQGDQVTVSLRPAVRGVVAGQPFTTGVMQPDVPGPPTVLTLGRLRMHVIKRGQRFGLRVRDPESPAARNFRPLTFYPVNLAYRVTGTWAPSDGTRTINVPDVIGDTTPTPVPGVVQFRLDGQNLTLTPVGGDVAKGLFFVFSDLTAKADTYPAGRFLETGPVNNGAVVLDFNQAYNPPCAVTPYATCPVAPKENRLPVAIPAGEKYDRKHGVH